MSAADISNAENKALVDHIRELATYLAKKAVPKLINWSQLFERTINIRQARLSDYQQETQILLNSNESDLNLGMSILGKRQVIERNDHQTRNNNIEEDLFSMKLNKAIEVSKEKFDKINQLISEIRSVLIGKCKEFFSDEKI
jgi:hypothetical protein